MKLVNCRYLLICRHYFDDFEANFAFLVNFSTLYDDWPFFSLLRQISSTLQQINNHKYIKNIFFKFTLKNCSLTSSSNVANQKNIALCFPFFNLNTKLPKLPYPSLKQERLRPVHNVVLSFFVLFFLPRGWPNVVCPLKSST